jgi:anti-sigma B factor antagonist
MPGVEDAIEPMPDQFEVAQDVEPDGVVRVSLRGELDLSTAEPVRVTLAQLIAARTPTRLDLSGLSFMDSTGFQRLYESVRAAREAGCQLEIADELMPQVRRLIELIDGRQLLWPGATN